MTTTTGTQTVASRALHKGAMLAIVLVSYFMIILDNSVIFTGLPSLQAEFGMSATELAWVQDAYTLVFGGLLLVGARAGDLLGRKPVFITGLIIFSTASLLIAIAPASWLIIAARALQGIGAAIVAPSSLALITASFEGEERNRAVAWYSAAAGIGASLGMVVGGAAASLFSWRAGFFINVPIGIAMLLLAPRFLPGGGKQSGRFDVLGAVASMLGVGALVFAILFGAEFGWDSPVPYLSAAFAVVALALFVFIESRAAQPIVPLHLFSSPVRTGAYVTRLLYLASMIGFFYFTSQFLQLVFGFTPVQAGLAFLPMTIVNFVVALAIPRLVRRFGGTIILVVGVVVTLAGIFWLSRVTADSSYLVSVALPMVLIGAGQGLALAPLTSFGIAGADASDAGAASGVLNTFHQIGSSLGLGILVAIGTAAASSATAGAAAVTAEVSTALLGASAFLAIATAVILFTIVPATRRR